MAGGAQPLYVDMDRVFQYELHDLHEKHAPCRRPRRISSEKVRQVLEICIQFLSLGIYSVFTYYSLIVYRSLVVSGRVSPALRIPMYLVYSALCIGFFLSVVRTIQLIVELIMEMRGKKSEHLKMMEEMQETMKKEGI